MSQWITNKRQSGHHVIKRDEGHLPMVADVYGTDAEARLIAAAPELLAVAEGLLKYSQERGCAEVDLDVENLIDDASAAIAKAKGGE